MKKEIKVDKDHKFMIDTGLGWAYVYKEQFGTDVLPETVPLIESAFGIAADFYDSSDAVTVRDLISEAAGTLSGTDLTTLTNIIWALAKNADESIPEPREFYNQFDCFSVTDILPKIIWTMADSILPTKKVKSLKETIEKFKTETGSHSTK